MKVTITLEFDGDNAEYVGKYSGGCDIGLLLRDALGEFQAAREPAAEYVAKRYPNIALDQHRAFKIRDVEKRVTMARMLAGATVIIMLDDV
jgi:hypothetical protein